MRADSPEQRNTAFNPLLKPKVIDLFAGCGGFSYGFLKAGYEIVGFVEQWQPAIDTYLQNHPHALHIGRDITKIRNDFIVKFNGKTDIIIGGPPCQGFSLCGNRNPKDKRNQLYKQFLRFVQVIEPKIVIIENVQGLLSMKDDDGEKVLHKIIEQLIEMDYFVNYKVLNAANYAVPQNRNRLIIIAKREDLFPKSSSEKKTVFDAIKDLPLRENRINGHLCFSPTQETVAKIKNLKQGEKLCKKFNASRRRLFADKPSRTIVTKPMYIHPIYDRFLTPRELARLQSFPDSFSFCGSKNDMVGQIGNAVPPLLAQAIAEKIKKVVTHGQN